MARVELVNPSTMEYRFVEDLGELEVAYEEGFTTPATLSDVDELERLEQGDEEDE